MHILYNVQIVHERILSTNITTASGIIILQRGHGNVTLGKMQSGFFEDLKNFLRSLQDFNMHHNAVKESVLGTLEHISFNRNILQVT